MGYHKAIPPSTPTPTPPNNRLRTGRCICLTCKSTGKHRTVFGYPDARFPYGCTVGPDWPCMLVTYTLLVVPGWLVAWFIFPRTVLGEAGKYVELLLGAATVVAFLFTSASDPGIVFKELYEVLEASGGGSAIDVESGGGGGGDSALIDEIAASLEGGRRVAARTVVIPSASTASKTLRPASKVPKKKKPVPCQICKLDRPDNASHCYECGVCVLDLDHHCPWTGKCIGKRNLKFFYVFLFTLTAYLLWTTLGVAIFAFTQRPSY